jgi:ubiquinone/menaquinone biosynthesis C-methylase UbiE
VQRRVLRHVVGQFMRPHGVGGHVTGWVMAHRRSNRRRSHWVVSLLDVQPGDRILEIGFGPGVAVQDLAARATRGTVSGIDHSALMARLARRRNAAAVRAGRVDLRVASVAALPDFGGPIDTILAINSIGFWEDPVTRLEELRACLRPGGRIAIASQPRCPGATEATSAQAAREIEEMLLRAGFDNPRVETLALVPPAVCVIAERH